MKNPREFYAPVLQINQGNQHMQNERNSKIKASESNIREVIAKKSNLKKGKGAN